MRPHAIVGMMVFAVISGGTVWTQEGARMIAPGPGQPVPPLVDFKIELLAAEPFEMGDPVEDAPYSAEIVTEVTQELTDGNRIERRTMGAVARDSRGRVRREHQLAPIAPFAPAGEARMVTISDPVAGVHYGLDPVRKVAMVSHAPRFHERARPTLVVSSSAGGPETALGIAREPEPPDVQTEQLGTKQYEGVRAEGTRTVATLRAGTIGNVRPIEIVSERWYSPELRVVVFSRRTDPRFGETIYRLTNITPGEPDAALFQMPADYTREDMRPASFGRKIER